MAKRDRKAEQKRKEMLARWPAIELRWALGDQQFEAAGQMLAEKPEILDADAYGSESAMHFWSVENRPDIVKWLLERGADPNRGSEIGSALSEAACLGHVEVCRLLIDAGADVGYRDGGEETALHKASSAGRPELIEMLIAAGAEVNAKEMCGETPWDQALRRKVAEVRALLEKHGGESGLREDEAWEDE